MVEFVAHSEFAEAVAQLLSRYGFDLEGRSPQFIIARWLQHYPETWLRSAVLEALYQGRYKAVSVEQILKLWQRRGHPMCHFNGEFERIICDELPHRPIEAEAERGAPESVSLPATPTAKAVVKSVAAEAGDGNYGLVQDSPCAFPSSKGSASGDAKPDEIKFSTWVQAAGGPHPIHRFVPVAEPSSFYARLKEIAQNGEEPALPQPNALPSSLPDLKDPQLENVASLDPEHLG
ncbi:MAG: hypothetical protein ACFB8W_11490 [Elainellaceae cyanobacterium]